MALPISSALATQQSTSVRSKCERVRLALRTRLLLAWNIIRDTRSQPSRENLELVVPWLNLAVIFLVVYAVALAATLAPAVRASNVRPAEALRYQ